MTANTGNPSETDLPLLNTSIIALADDNFQIKGGQCVHCGQLHYPYSEFCMSCGSAVAERAFATAGKVYSFTTVQMKAPYGLPEPYTVGYIELKENGLRVFGLFSPDTARQVKIGVDVEVEVQPIGLNSQKQPCLRPVFTVVSKEDG